MTHAYNRRAVLALRDLADRLESCELPVGAPINEALSNTPGGNDAERLLALLQAAGDRKAVTV